MRDFIKKISALGGLFAFLAAVGFLAGRLLATTLTLTDHVNTQTGAQTMATINANYAALRSVINGNLTKDNLKSGMVTGDKLTKSYLNLTGAIVQADLDPSLTIGLISASATNGVVSGYSALRAHAQTVPDLTLKIEPGVYKIGEKTFLYTGGNSPVITRPTALPRIAVLAIDPNGAFAAGAAATGVWIYGTENASPVPPLIMPGLAPIVYVYSRTAAGACDRILDTDDGNNRCYVWREGRPETFGREVVLFRDDFNWFFSAAGAASDWPSVYGYNDLNCDPSLTARTIECSSGAGTRAAIGASPIGATGQPTDAVKFRLDRGTQIRLRFRLKFDTTAATGGFAVGLTSNNATTTSVVNWNSFVGLRWATPPTLLCEAESSGFKSSSSGYPIGTLGSWHTYEMLITSTSLKVYVDDILNGCTVTTNLPATAALFFAIRGETNAGESQNFDLDYWEISDVGPILAP